LVSITDAGGVSSPGRSAGEEPGIEYRAGITREERRHPYRSRSGSATTCAAERTNE
jgi:hypothetical protein